jgi:hypothetical protein
MQKAAVVVRFETPSHNLPVIIEGSYDKFGSKYGVPEDIGTVHLPILS